MTAARVGRCFLLFLFSPLSLLRFVTKITVRAWLHLFFETSSGIETTRVGSYLPLFLFSLLSL
jgi:hypothetical protein